MFRANHLENQLWECIVVSSPGRLVEEEENPLPWTHQKQLLADANHLCQQILLSLFHRPGPNRNTVNTSLIQINNKIRWDLFQAHN